MSASDQFIALRDALLSAGSDVDAARHAFQWRDPEYFNWVRDYFDRMADGNERAALRVVDDAGTDRSYSFAHMARRSHQVANFLADRGVGPGDRVLIMLGNVVALWETMLGVIRLGAVMIPATTLLQRDDLADRLERGVVTAVVADASLAERFSGLPGAPVRIAVNGVVDGWHDYADSEQAESTHRPLSATRPSDLMLLYFTSGTTARPKLVAHTQTSYPVGHLSTMYWVGLKPGDIHLNLSSPGWAKHAWSCFFAPWNAGATVVAYQYDRFTARGLLDVLVRTGATTFCAPPTVWRMLIQEPLADWKIAIRELVGAGEPLNPEVIERVQAEWGITLRDGFGQTETTAQVGNPPGVPLKPGSMGRPLPGYEVVLLNADGVPSDEGELCLPLDRRPVGLMYGYLGDAEKQADAMHGGYYHTGDVARRDADGYITYVGRSDDVFKSSDYRISPFELESLLIEHPAVAEAAVVPSPDALRLSVPKAFIVLAAGFPPDAAVAHSIFEYVRSRVSPYKRVRRIEFAALPKTISGKIRRVELRMSETQRNEDEHRNTHEYWEEDFPAFRSGHA
jgi:acetyl-CoA synthetase